MTREEGIERLKDGPPFSELLDVKWEEAINMAIEALEQEPFINKPCISEKVCEHDKQIVLDKIRAEIEKELCHSIRDEYSQRQNDYCDGVEFAGKRCLEIIGKHISGKEK